MEDEKGLAEGLRAVLLQEYYMVDIVYDGISGLEYILSNIYDIIILDIMLPKLNGIDILKNARNEGIKNPDNPAYRKISGTSKHLDIILSEAERMKSLIKRLLTLAMPMNATTAPNGNTFLFRIYVRKWCYHLRASSLRIK